MSLVAFAIRVAAVRTLREALPSGFDVLDSPQEPMDRLDCASPAPFVAVYTGHNETEIDAREMLGGKSKVDLAIQFVLPASLTFPLSGGGSITLDTRKQGAETALDVLWRRAACAFDAGASPWASLWREFVINTPKIVNASYLIEVKTVRAVAREVVVSCEPIHEPIPGAAPEGAWAALLELMRADQASDGLAGLADWLEAEISGPAELTPAQRDAAYLGLSAYAAENVAILEAASDVGNIPDGTAQIEVTAEGEG